MESNTRRFCRQSIFVVSLNCQYKTFVDLWMKDIDIFDIDL